MSPRSLPMTPSQGATDGWRGDPAGSDQRHRADGTDRISTMHATRRRGGFDRTALDCLWASSERSGRSSAIAVECSRPFACRGRGGISSHHYIRVSREDVRHDVGRFRASRRDGGRRMDASSSVDPMVDETTGFARLTPDGVGSEPTRIRAGLATSGALVRPLVHAPKLRTLCPCRHSPMPGATW